MNSSLEVLKQVYKPYRYTLKKKSIILETTAGNYVVKEKGSTDIKELYSYLISRNFDNFPALIDGERNEVNVYEYVEDITTPIEQKSLDMADVVASLHNKTTYFKEVSEDTYKSIFESISSNINYLSSYYGELMNKINREVYMSPSHYLIARNSSKIFAALDFCQKELDEWYELVKTKTKERVALIHNNLSTEHLLKGSRDALISWDNSKVDSPVLDMIKFYQNDYQSIDFEEVFKRYLERYPLNEEEKKLFFITISIPKEIKLTKRQFDNCKEIREKLDYLFKTESLVRPYYAVEEVE